MWIPFPEALPQLSDLDVTLYEGGAPAADLSAVELYVVPYTFDASVHELIPRMPRLRVVQTLTAGYEHVLPYLREGILLCNARGVHEASTAELAMTLTLASLRGIPQFVRAAERREWVPGFQPALADKHVLIVGYGAIGEAIERRLAGFEVASVTRVARRPRSGVSPVSELPRLLPAADVVILVIPLTAETEGMVDGDFLASMKDDALLVNVARGKVVDTDALVAELASGRLHAALDVTDPEPLPAEHPLWALPNALVSPHVAGASSAFRPRALQLMIDQVRRYASGQRPENIVWPA